MGDRKYARAIEATLTPHSLLTKRAGANAKRFQNHTFISTLIRARERLAMLYLEDFIECELEWCV